MRAIYLANYNLEDKTSGVSKKILMQLDSFENLGVNIEAPKVFADSIISKIYARVPLTSNFYDWHCSKYLRSINIEDYDFVYVRHNLITRQLINNLRYIRKKGVKVFYEIPTYPYDKNENDPINHFLRKKDFKWRGKLHEVVDYVVDYSGTKTIYGVPTIGLTNGINLKGIRQAAHDDQKKTIDLIAVALMAEVHGFDRIIAGMHNYYANRNDDQRIVRFHVVGEGASKNRLEEMVRNFGLEKYVIFYGLRSGEDLDRIYDTCDIGVGVLGIHRRYKNQKVSSLKTKEYAAKGLPFITGENDDAFKNGDFKYNFQVESTDDPVNIREVIEWYDSICMETNVEKISNQIREYAKKNLTWDTQLQKVLVRV